MRRATGRPFGLLGASLVLLVSLIAVITLLPTPFALPSANAPVTPSLPPSAGSRSPSAVVSLGGVSPGATTSMAFDSASGATILVAPDPAATSRANATVETFSYSDGFWSPLGFASAPSSRAYESLTYDEGLEGLLLFGGVNAAGALLNDTWSFTSSGWTNLSASVGPAPSARASAELAYDNASGEAILFGGSASLSSPFAAALTDSWSFSSAGWRAINGSSHPFSGGSMAYDAALGAVVAFGGITPSGGCSGSTFEFASGLWTNVSSSITGSPGGLALATMAYDASTGAIELFGGVCESELLGIPTGVSVSGAMWTLSNGHWSKLAASGGPGPRYGVDLAVNATSNTTLLFGGAYVALVLLTVTLDSVLYASTYSLAGASWTLVGPSFLADHLEAAANTSFALRLTGLLGIGGSMGAAFRGAPAGCRPMASDELLCNVSAPGNFSLAANVTTLLGIALVGPSTANDSASTSLRVLPAHGVLALRVGPSQGEIGVPMAVQASVLAGVGFASIGYSGLPGGCASQNSTGFTCTPSVAGSFRVGASIVGLLGVLATASASLSIASHPSVASVALSHGATDVGIATEMSVEMAGGVGPFTMGYAGLPGGCASQNTTALACRPGSVGTFSVTVTGTDGFGFSASAVAAMVVNARPSVTSVGLSERNLSLGGTTTLDVSIAGGTAPFTVAYTGLPEGCASSNALEIRCAPTVAGNFNILVRVTDAVGVTANGSAMLSVSEHAGPGGGQPGGGAIAPFLSNFAEGLASALVVIVLLGALIGLAVVRQRRLEGQRLAAELREHVASEGAGLADGGPEPPRP